MTDPRLPVPVRRILREPFDELELEAARAQIRSAPERPTRTTGMRVAVALCVVVAAVAVWVSASVSRSPGRLQTDGHLFAGVLEGAHRISLDDGSLIEVTRASQISVLENSDREVGLLVSRGKATFDVRPGGPRRWTIECGLATVVVVGTHFTIERDPERVRVSVSRGVVLVRGELVPDRAQRVTAGNALEVRDRARAAGTVVAATPAANEAFAGARPTVNEVSPSEEAAATTSSPPALTKLEGRPTEPRRGAWRAAADRGEYTEAYSALGPDGLAARSRNAGVDELLALADVARLSGHPAQAVEPLARIVASHRADPNAPLAAFTLGCVEADTLHEPARAAQAFEQALALGLPHGLEPDAIARLARAWQAAGNPAAARQAAGRYLAAQPRGTHAPAMRLIVGTSP